MKQIHCPICDASFVVEFDGKPYKEEDITKRVKSHILRHSIDAILERIDDIWATEYLEVTEKRSSITKKVVR